MATTYRIAVIGSWESVMGFRALGLETYPVTAPEEARETIRELAKSGDCGIIYLTEQLAKDLPDVLDRYKDELRPAIILIPGREGSLGIGMNNSQQSIQRAVGADILRGEQADAAMALRFSTLFGPQSRLVCTPSGQAGQQVLPHLPTGGLPRNSPAFPPLAAFRLFSLRCAGGRTRLR